jgi:hypothetical protein
VWFIGYPNGTAYDVSAGQVSQVEALLIKYRVPGWVPGSYSGGPLLDRDGMILGLIRQDQPPNGEATRIDLVVDQLKAWSYQVALQRPGSDSPRVTRSEPPVGLAEPQPVILTGAESLDALRRLQGVRALRDLENDLNLRRLPAGVYGFTVPWIINTDPTAVVGGTGVDRISLEQSSMGTLVMEIHKTANGEIYVVGYLSEADLVRLQDPSRREDAEVTFFFMPYQEFNQLVAIPISRIVNSLNRSVGNSQNRSVGSQYVNDLSIR